jgi:hypothetical protein
MRASQQGTVILEQLFGLGRNSKSPTVYLDRCRGDADSSAATRLSPKSDFLVPICTMSLRMFSGSRGRPACDFHFQNIWKPWRLPADQHLGFDDCQGIFPIARVSQRMGKKGAESFIVLVAPAS